MTARDIMTRGVGTCTPNHTLGAAASAMREYDCGFVPVVDPHGAVVGVITDRDICNAVATKHRTAEHIAARHVMAKPVISCLPDAELEDALGTMAGHHVRRLPVIDAGGHLHGVLSLDDIVLATELPGGPPSDVVVTALRGICGPKAGVRELA